MFLETAETFVKKKNLWNIFELSFNHKEQMNQPNIRDP